MDASLSAAAQLAASKSLYVKSADVRLRNQRWTPHQTSNRHNNPPPVPPRKPKISPKPNYLQATSKTMDDLAQLPNKCDYYNIAKASNCVSDNVRARFATPEPYTKVPIYAKLSLSVPYESRIPSASKSPDNKIGPNLRSTTMNFKRQKSLPSLVDSTSFVHVSKKPYNNHVSTAQNNHNNEAQIPTDTGTNCNNLDGFFDSMGLSPAVLHGLSLVGNRDEDGTIVFSSVPSSVYSPSKTDSDSPSTDPAIKPTPISMVERNARVLKWMYSAWNSS